MRRGRKEEEKERKEKARVTGIVCSVLSLLRRGNVRKEINVLTLTSRTLMERQARSASQIRASMITADAGISIAHVKSRANCMVLPTDKKYRGTAIRCTLPGETVVGGHVIQQLSLGEEIVVKVVALQGASPIMPMTILTDMAGWTVETVDSIPKHLVAIDTRGHRRPMNRYDGLHYLKYDDFVACMNDVYKKVNMVGQVTRELLMSSLGKLQAKKKKNSLMSLSETDEQQAPFDSGLRAGTNGGPGAEGQIASNIQVPKELEDFVLPQDPSNINRTKMGAKTGRGTGFDAEFKYVTKNTLDPQKEELRKALHSLASLHPQNISYTSVVVTKLHAGQEVGPHRDVKNDDSVPNHTICFGNFEGGLFQVMRQTENGSDAWEIVGLARTWVSFYAKSLRQGFGSDERE
eukprot:1497311-Amphidinium_carterae.2